MLSRPDAKPMHERIATNTQLQNSVLSVERRRKFSRSGAVCPALRDDDFARGARLQRRPLFADLAGDTFDFRQGVTIEFL